MKYLLDLADYPRFWEQAGNDRKSLKKACKSVRGKLRAKHYMALTWNGRDFGDGRGLHCIEFFKTKDAAMFKLTWG